MKMILAAGAFAIAATAFHAGLAVAGSREFVAKLGRTQEYVGTDAWGEARFWLSEDRNSLRYEVTAKGLENFTQAHIHLMPDALSQESLLKRFKKPSTEDQHGRLVVFLTDFERKGIEVDGMLAEGVIRETDLVGPLKGFPVRVLAELMAGEDAYVALHVLKPIPPNNTFCCPVGLRGIIKPERTQ
jgi:hypothetical protein